jgi:tellurite resistance protein
MSPFGAHASGLAPEARLELIRFACGFAWLDGGPQPEEKRLIRALAERLGLSPAELLKVTEWLAAKPDPKEPRLEVLPPEQRRLFLEVAIAVADAKKRRHPSEQRALAWLSAQLAEIAQENLRGEKVHARASDPPG